VKNKLIIVDGYRATSKDRTNLRKDTWSLALDQRAFGPRRLVVALSDRRGRFIGLSHTPRTDPPEIALGPCIDHIGGGAVAAVAFCDERIKEGPPPPELVIRFGHARSIAEAHGVHLVDWITCDDQLFRSTRLALDPNGTWWDVP